MTASQANPGNRPPVPPPEIIRPDRLRRGQRHLRAPFRLRLSAPDSEEIITCGAVLRHLPGKRLVCRASRANGDDVIVKLFLAPRHAWRHCRRERAGISALQQAGIPTPALLRPTTLEDEKTPLVLTSTVAGARSLADCWPDAEDPVRRTMMGTCARLIARLHRCGYVQQDAHPGNFLVAPNQVLMIDGDAVRKLPTPAILRRQRRLANLAHFLVQFDPDAERWAPEALRAYEQQRGLTDHPERILYLKRLMRRCRHKRMRRRAAKVTRNCTDIAVHHRWRRYTAYDRQWYTDALQPLLDDPDRTMDAGHPLKEGNSATVVRVRHQGRTLVIKRYNIKNRWHHLRRCLRSSRGRTAWRNAHMLQLIGINTPPPRALIEERWGPFRARAFLVCDHQAGVNLSAHWPHDGQITDRRMDALPAVAGLIDCLHAAQISHGDMKASNLIVDGGRVFLMDLDGLRIVRSPQRFKRHFRKDGQRLLDNWPKGSRVHDALRIALANAPGAVNRAASRATNGAA